MNKLNFALFYRDFLSGINFMQNSQRNYFISPNKIDVILHFTRYIFIIICSELKKLSEESLTRQPEEVFDIICKLGEG